MSDLIIPGPDGKPMFMGKEDSNNPPAQPRKGNQIECPICHNMVDFLLGQDTKDGGKMGCPKDYVEGTVDNLAGTYDTDKEIM